jgi:hypothetical protein
MLYILTITPISINVNLVCAGEGRRARTDSIHRALASRGRWRAHDDSEAPARPRVPGLPVCRGLPRFATNRRAGRRFSMRWRPRDEPGLAGRFAAFSDGAAPTLSLQRFVPPPASTAGWCGSWAKSPKSRRVGPLLQPRHDWWRPAWRTAPPNEISPCAPRSPTGARSPCCSSPRRHE